MLFYNGSGVGTIKHFNAQDYHFQSYHYETPYGQKVTHVEPKSFLWANINKYENALWPSELKMCAQNRHSNWAQNSLDSFNVCMSLRPVGLNGSKFEIFVYFKKCVTYLNNRMNKDFLSSMSKRSQVAFLQPVFVSGTFDLFDTF